MATPFALPIIPGGTGILPGVGGTGAPPVSASRPGECGRPARQFGRERAGAVRARFHRLVVDDLRSAYLSDDRPWVVGFSGGKDSTCLMQFVYYMTSDLDGMNAWRAPT